MKLSDIRIRDPYILLHEGIYYLYGTRSDTCWGPADGFDCYTSEDLVSWSGPFEIFHKPEGFFADEKYWAPECYSHQGRFYLVTTLSGEGRKPGVYILTADSPLGPFAPFSDRPLTPECWACIDGSLFFENDRIYLLFSHSFEDNPDGEMYGVELSDDLSQPVSEPFLLFRAADAPWATPVPFAEAEFGTKGKVYFSDGPCMYRSSEGTLEILWASWSDRGYAVGAATSLTGDIHGPWSHRAEKFFPEDGGHGMLFTTKEGKRMYTLHYPNEKRHEHPIIVPVVEIAGVLQMEQQHANKEYRYGYAENSFGH